MKPQIYTLKNGLRVVVAEMPESQSVTANIMIGVGSRYEQPKINGLSHFLEHLLFKGTAKRPEPSQISTEIDAVGGWNNAYTSAEMTSFFVKVPRQHTALALDILSDMITNPLFLPEEIDRERGVIIEEMNVIRDEPDRYVGELITPLIWPGDPLSAPTEGNEKVIQAVSRQTIIDFKNRHYKPANIVVSVAGHITAEAVLEQVERQLGDLAKQPRPPRAKLKSSKPTEISAGLVRDTNQAHFLIGAEAYPLDHPDDAASRVMSAILGRGMSSRLFLKLREQLGLAYAVHSGYESFTDTGIFEIYAGVATDKTAEAVAAAIGELKIIRRSLVEKNELLKAKNQLRGALQMDMENNARISDQLGSELLLANHIMPFEEWLARIDAVTIDDVRRVAQDLLAPDRLRFAIIAPETETAQRKFKQLVRS